MLKRFLGHLVLLAGGVLTLFWLLTNDFPERVYIDAEASPDTIVESDSGRSCRFTGEGRQINYLWLPSGFRQGEFTLYHRPDAGSVLRVFEVRVVSRLFLERRWSNSQGFDQLIFRDDEASVGVSADAGKVISGLLLELFMIAFALAWLVRPERARRPECRPHVHLAVAFAAAFFCVLVVPLQTLLANNAELNLPTLSVLAALSWRFVIVFAVLAAVLHWSTRFAGSMYLILVSAFVVYEYLETGLLSVGCPSLAGDMTYYLNWVRMLWDTLVFVGVLGLVAFLRRRWPVTLSLLPLAVCVLGLASLVDVRSSGPELETQLGVSLKSKRYVVRESVYSARRNVLVYMLDCTSSSHLLELFAENPSFAAPLDGFICYTNHLGVYEETVTSVAALSTGKLLTDSSQIIPYAYSAFSRDSFLASYLGENAAVFCNTGSFPDGIAVGGDRTHVDLAVREQGPLHRRMEDQQRWNLSEIVAFRLTPFAGKFAIWTYIACGWSLPDSADDEFWAYPILAKAPIREDLGCALHFFHTIGDHPPYGIARDGVWDGAIRDDYPSKLDKLWVAWTKLLELVETLKRRGLYDNSMIIITADHGNEGPKDRHYHILTDGKLTDRAWPLMMVKPIGAKGSLAMSNVPTSHQRFHDLMTAASVRDLSAAEVTELLRCSERCYRVVAEGGFDCARVDDAKRFRVDLEPNSAGRAPLEPIVEGENLSLLGSDEPRPWVRLESLSYWDLGGPVFTYKAEQSTNSYGRISFLVKNPGPRTVIFSLCGARGTEARDAVSGRTVRVPTEYDRVRHPLKIVAEPDEHGIITIDFRSCDHAALFSLTVRHPYPTF